MSASLQAESKLQQAHVHLASNSWASWSPWQLLNYDTLFYDKIIDFVWEVAYGNTLEKVLSQRQMNEVTEFIIALARHGVRDDDLEGKAQLEEAIARLRSGQYDTDPSDAPEGWWFSRLNKQDYPEAALIPAVLYGFEKPQILHTGWLSESWKQTKKFIKKHKKVIIVSSVVVVASTVIIVVTAGTATAPVLEGTAAAIGAAAADKRSRDQDKKHRAPVNKPGEVYVHDTPEEYNHLPTVPNPPQGYITSTPQLELIPERSALIKESIAKQSTILREELSENTIIPDEPLNIPPQEQPSFWYQAVDKARETGSTIVHEVYDGIADQLSIIPSITGYVSEKMNNFSEFLSENSPFEGSPIDHYQSSVNAVHEKIDESFGTNHANIYSQEGKAAREGLTTGMLPPPGTIKGTQPNSTKGWKTGLPKENLKYEATEENLARMEKGLAPQYKDAKGNLRSVELHHEPPQREGGLFDFEELRVEEHIAKDTYRSE